MGRSELLRRMLGVALVACLSMSVAAPALAQDEADDMSWEGAYAVVGTTNTGKQVNATVIVQSAGTDMIQFRTNIMGFPVSSTGQATWSGADQVTVPVSAYIPLIADGSGTITLTRGSTSWDMSGSGTGEAFGTSGSATVAGSKPTDFGTTDELEADVSGVSEAAQGLDNATGSLQPGDQPAIDTEDVVSVAATILFLAFLWILLEMLFGFLLI